MPQADTTIVANHRWQARLLQWLILAGLLAGIYWKDLILWAAQLWDDPNYSHGLLIPFVSIYFVRERFEDLKASRSAPFLPALLLVVAALTLYILGYIGAEFFSKRISFVLLLYGMILFLEGKKVAQILFFPVFILFFAVPLPYILYNAIAFPLKLIASQVSAVIFDLAGIPVFREGNIISLPHTTLEVVDACSGIRSLMTLLTLSFFLAYFQHRAIWRQVLVFVMALPIAVVANASRVSLTGILTMYDPRWGEGSLHDFSGWLVFIVSFAGLGLVSTLLRSRKNSKRTKG